MDAEEGVFCMVLRSDLFCDRMRFPFGCVAFGCVFLSDVFCFRMCFTFGCRSGERPRPQKYWLSRDPGCPGEWRRLRIPASSFPRWLPFRLGNGRNFVGFRETFCHDRNKRPYSGCPKEERPESDFPAICGRRENLPFRRCRIMPRSSRGETAEDP